MCYYTINNNFLDKANNVVTKNELIFLSAIHNSRWICIQNWFNENLLIFWIAVFPSQRSTSLEEIIKPQIAFTSTQNL